MIGHAFVHCLQRLYPWHDLSVHHDEAGSENLVEAEYKYGLNHRFHLGGIPLFAIYLQLAHHGKRGTTCGARPECHC